VHGVARRQAFDGCHALVSAKLPPSVRDIQAFAFDQCINLKEVDLWAPEPVLEVAPCPPPRAFARTSATQHTSATRHRKAHHTPRGRFGRRGRSGGVRNVP